MAECPTCEKQLETEHGVKLHHATVHDESLVQNEWVCNWCNEGFTRPESQVRNEQKKFCSKKCHGNWIAEYEHTRLEVNCEYCGNEFERRESELQPRENYFCSHECHGDWKLDQGSDTVECENCGVDVVKNQYRIDNSDHHFCSTDCQGKWYSDNVHGEDHPLWKDGVVASYGPTWEAQRQSAISRDDEQCVDCGMTRDEHYDEYGADLEVHHQTPIRTFNDTEEANKLSNLVTVCTNCHQKREHS